MKIYTSKECNYCTKLKKGLDNAKINYIEVDVDNVDNGKEVREIYSLVGEGIIPLIAIKPHLLVPRKTFNTIEEALELIKTLIK